MTDLGIDVDAPVPTGMPRPRQSGLPVPYITDRGWMGDVRWSQIHWTTQDGKPGRGSECVAGFLCQVCAEPCPDDDMHLVAHRDGLRMAATRPPVASPGGPMHLKCARLAYAVCPALRRDTDAVLVAVTRAALEITHRPMTRRDVEVAHTYTITGSWREVCPAPSTEGAAR